MNNTLRLSTITVIGVLIVCAMLYVGLRQGSNPPSTSDQGTAVTKSVNQESNSDVILTNVEGRIAAINGRTIEITSTVLDERGKAITYSVVVQEGARLVKHVSKTQEEIAGMRDEKGYVPAGTYLSNEIAITFDQIVVGDYVIAAGLPDDRNPRSFSASALIIGGIGGNESRYQPVP